MREILTIFTQTTTFAVDKSSLAVFLPDYFRAPRDQVGSMSKLVNDSRPAPGADIGPLDAKSTVPVVVEDRGLQVRSGSTLLLTPIVAGSHFGVIVSVII